MERLTEKEINDLAYEKAASTSWCDSFSYSEGMKDLQKLLFNNKEEWNKIHEAFITAMKIDENKSIYDHLQQAFNWFKENIK